MSKLIVSLMAGIIFAVGLSLSGMLNPNKVIGFLDFLGRWDPSLLFVMGGAIGVNLLSFRFILKNKPVLVDSQCLPTKKIIDAKLVTGALIFGVGWGLSGICPGPGIVSLVSLKIVSIGFICSMTTGMLIMKKILD